MPSLKENPLVEKFFIHLYNCRDTDNLIIKGHILTEYALNYFIEMNSVEKLALKDTRFTYLNKIDIAKILGLFKSNPSLYNELKLLNKLRNSIAHNLKYDLNILIELLKGFEKYKNALKSEKLNNLELEKEIFYDLGDEKITVKGEHLLLMFYISIICMKIFSSYNPKDKEVKNPDIKF